MFFYNTIGNCRGTVHKLVPLLTDKHNIAIYVKFRSSTLYVIFWELFLAQGLKNTLLIGVYTDTYKRIAIHFIGNTQT